MKPNADIGLPNNFPELICRCSAVKRRYIAFYVAVNSKNKNPAERPSLPGHVVKRVSLIVSPASCNSNALSAQGLTFFTTAVLAWFLVALFQLQAFEQTVVLNFFLQNPHGLFEIVVEDFNFNCFQTGSTPFFSHRVDKLALLFQP